MKDCSYEDVVNYGKKDVLFEVSANKSDLYEKKQIDDDEGEQFEKSIGGIFTPMLAKNDLGITEVFDSVGQKILNKSDFEFFTIETIEKIKKTKKKLKKKMEKKIKKKI